MKRLHLQRRVEKSKLRELRSLQSMVHWRCAALEPAVECAGGKHTQSGTTRHQASAAEYSCATGPEATGTRQRTTGIRRRTDVIP